MSRYKSRYESRYERNQSRGYRTSNNKGKKLNLKKVFMVLIIIILAIYVISKMGDKNEIKVVEQTPKNEEIVVQEKQYYLCLDNEKWGVIDEAGKEIIPTEYDDMIQVLDSSKDIFICYYDVDYSKKEYKTKVLNKDNIQILTEFENVEGIINGNSSYEIWYEENILTYKKDGKMGLIDFERKYNHRSYL